MTGTLFLLLGAALLLGSVFAGYWVMNAQCESGSTPACEAGIIEQVSQLMISDTGLLFWLAWVAGVFLIWGGMRLKSVGR